MTDTGPPAFVPRPRSMSRTSKSQLQSAEPAVPASSSTIRMPTTRPPAKAPTAPNVLATRDTAEVSPRQKPRAPPTPNITNKGGDVRTAPDSQQAPSPNQQEGNSQPPSPLVAGRIHSSLSLESANRDPAVAPEENSASQSPTRHTNTQRQVVSETPNASNDSATRLRQSSFALHDNEAHTGSSTGEVETTPTAARTFSGRQPATAMLTPPRLRQQGPTSPTVIMIEPPDTAPSCPPVPRGKTPVGLIPIPRAPELRALKSPLSPVSPTPSATSLWIRVEVSELLASATTASDVIAIAIRSAGPPSRAASESDTTVIAFAPVSALREQQHSGSGVTVHGIWHVDEWRERQPSSQGGDDIFHTAQLSIEIRYGDIPNSRYVIVARGTLPAYTVAVAEPQGTARVPVVPEDAYTQTRSGSLSYLTNFCTVTWQRTLDGLPPSAVFPLKQPSANTMLFSSPDSFTESPRRLRVVDRSYSSLPSPQPNLYDAPYGGGTAEIEARLRDIEAEAAVLRSILAQRREGRS